MNRTQIELDIGSTIGRTNLKKIITSATLGDDSSVDLMLHFNNDRSMLVAIDGESRVHYEYQDDTLLEITAYHDNKLHDEDNPSIVRFFATGEPSSKEWYLDDFMFSTSGPCYQKFDEQGKIASQMFACDVDDWVQRYPILQNFYDFFSAFDDTTAPLRIIEQKSKKVSYVTFHFGRKVNVTTTINNASGEVVYEEWWKGTSKHTDGGRPTVITAPNDNNRGNYEWFHEGQSGGTAWVHKTRWDLNRGGQGYHGTQLAAQRMYRLCDVDRYQPPMLLDVKPESEYNQTYRDGNIKITNKFSLGELHHDSEPAQVEFYMSGLVKSEKWFQHGILTREGGPATIRYDETGAIISQTFYRDDKRIKFNKWFKDCTASDDIKVQLKLTYG